MKRNYSAKRLLNYLFWPFRILFLYTNRPSFKSDTPPTFPGVLHQFERFYDENTGGWHSISLPYHRKKHSRIQYDSVELEVGHFYYQFVRLIKPFNIIETGVSKGYSTSCIAAALKTNRRGGHVYCIDPCPYPHLWWSTGLKEYITYFPKKSQDSLPELAGREYDLLVIDSLHNYDTCLWEVINFEKLLKPDGYILMHDSIYYAGVKAVVNQLTQNPRFEVTTLKTPRTHGTRQPCPGLTIVRKIRDGEPALVFENCYEGWEVYGSISFQDLSNEAVYDSSIRKLHVPYIRSQDGLMEMEFEKTLDSKEGVIRFLLLSERRVDKLISGNNVPPESSMAVFDHAEKTLCLPRVISINNRHQDPAFVNGYYESQLRLEEEHNGKQIFSLQYADLLACRE